LCIPAPVPDKEPDPNKSEHEDSDSGQSTTDRGTNMGFTDTEI
jgi:hypothetical protein